ncbi:MAG: YARHG domain-containing protein [Bacteroidia bacterium]
MNKYFLYLASLGVLVVLAISCQSEKKSQQSEEHEGGVAQTQNATAKTAEKEGADKPFGMYVGAFGPNKINIVVQKLEENGIVSGYSVVSGNQRPFTGTYKKSGEQYEIEAKEPGNDPYDGSFAFAINPQSKTAEGTWTPFKKSTPSRSFKLAQKSFAYNAAAGSYPETSEKLLAEADVENLLKQELRIMRNEIYARHGYSFKMKDMRSYFDQQDWYIPTTTDVRDALTEVEEKNVALLKRYEKYAADYYDEYGR